MKRRLPPPLATIGLIVFGLLDTALLGVIIKSSLAPIEAPQLATGALGDKSEKKVPEVSATQIGTLNRTLATPAFFRSRSPYVPSPPPTTVAPTAVAPTAPPPTVTVAGIVIDRRVKKALLLSPADSNGAWLSEGDQVIGWKVEAITPSGVTLRQNGLKIDIKMYPMP